MKTRKLLLLAAGFMLFALTAKAQFNPISGPSKHAYLYNYLDWTDPWGNKSGLEFQWSLVWEYYKSDGSTDINNAASTPRWLAYGQNFHYSASSNGVGEGWFWIKVNGTERNITRSQIESLPEWKYKFTTYMYGAFPVNVVVQLIRPDEITWAVYVYSE